MEKRHLVTATATDLRKGDRITVSDGDGAEKLTVKAIYRQRRVPYSVPSVVVVFEEIEEVGVYRTDALFRDVERKRAERIEVPGIDYPRGVFEETPQVELRRSIREGAIFVRTWKADRPGPTVRVNAESLMEAVKEVGGL